MSRCYTQLLGAMNELLAVLTADGDPEAALRASFEAAARGFGAQKALLLRVEEGEPRLRAVHALGRLSPEQVRACERGESVRGVSPSVLQRVIETGRPELIEEAQRPAFPCRKDHRRLSRERIDHRHRRHGFRLGSGRERKENRQENPLAQSSPSCLPIRFVSTTRTANAIQHPGMARTRGEETGNISPVHQKTENESVT